MSGKTVKTTTTKRPYAKAAKRGAKEEAPKPKREINDEFMEQALEEFKQGSKQIEKKLQMYNAFVQTIISHVDEERTTDIDVTTTESAISSFHITSCYRCADALDKVCSDPFCYNKKNLYMMIKSSLFNAAHNSERVRTALYMMNPVGPKSGELGVVCHTLLMTPAKMFIEAKRHKATNSRELTDRITNAIIKFIAREKSIAAHQSATKVAEKALDGDFETAMHGKIKIAQRPYRSCEDSREEDDATPPPRKHEKQRVPRVDSQTYPKIQQERDRAMSWADSKYDDPVEEVHTRCVHCGKWSNEEIQRHEVSETEESDMEVGV